MADVVGQVHAGHAAATHEPGERPSERDTLNAHIIGKVWLIDVVTFLSGRMTVSQVLEDLEATIAIVLPE